MHIYIYVDNMPCHIYIYTINIYIYIWHIYIYVYEHRADVKVSEFSHALLSPNQASSVYTKRMRCFTAADRSTPRKPQWTQYKNTEHVPK